MTTVRELGEQGLLQRLQAFCPAGLVGDDAAILSLPAGEQLVVTTDVLVDGGHFHDRTTAAFDAGWRAAAANLSDLAAMGATPIALTVGLGLPSHLSVTWVDQLYQGLTACLSPFHTPIAGGDVVRSPVITLSITALGRVTPDRLIQRQVAQPDQAIVATGYHGASRAGLECMLNPDAARSLPDDLRQTWITAHQRPSPRLDVVPWLWDTGETGAIAGMDSSDGLADAVLQICRASGVGAQLERSQLPIPPGLCDWVGAIQATQWTLYGGEDFELVLCLPWQKAQQLVTQLGRGATILGRTRVDREVWLTDTGDRYPPERLTLEQGFQHYS